MPVVQLKTASLRGKMAGAPNKKRVFTENEYNFLNTLSDEDLQGRIEQGKTLIGLLYRPEMMNMNQREAAKLSSNLRFQIDEIRKIIKKRSLKNG